MVLPRLTERMMGRYVHRAHFSDEPAAITTGNLYDPMGAEASGSGYERSRPGDTAESLVAHDDTVVDLRPAPSSAEGPAPTSPVAGGVD